jgi:hypothetical protein
MTKVPVGDDVGLIGVEVGTREGGSVGTLETEAGTLGGFDGWRELEGSPVETILGDEDA